jgi:tetratricopeptide (TPR) repeat protein
MRTTEQTMRERARLRPVMALTEFNRKAWPGFLLSTGRPEESLAAAKEMSTGRWPSSRAVGHAIMAQALLALGKAGEARAEMKAAQDELAQVPVASSSLGYSRGGVEPYVDIARGELLLRTGARDEGRALLKDVQARVRAVPGPDAWMEALFRLEEIARLAREVGDWDLAEYTAGQMREHDGAYAGTHYALGLVAEHKGDQAVARQAFDEAVRLWAKADSDLPELGDARARAGKAAVAATAAAGGGSPR